jgi:hypothetical protein
VAATGLGPKPFIGSKTAGVTPGPLADGWAALLLMLPAAIPYAAHAFRSWQYGFRPSGFLVYDLAFYMAHAREHFDDGGFRLFYGLPSSPFYETPAIYFQPYTLFLGLIWRLTGWDVGLVFVLFGVAAAWLCARAAVALYRQVVGRETGAGWWGLVIFFWGGGVLALAGALQHLAGGGALRGLLSFEPFFTLDPFDGWWFLYFGRNLLFPTEALYHALFFGVIWAILRRRFALAAGLALGLVASHPFTGVELMAILLAWLALECGILRSSAIPWRFVAACVAVAALGAAYYGGILPRSAEHRSVAQQYALPWLLPAASILAAYLPAAILAAWNFRDGAAARRFLGQPVNRLLLVWFVVALALSKHELVMKPVQPVHFTRGYIWIPLFLMGTGALAALGRRLRSGEAGIRGRVIAAVLLVFVLADDGLWLLTFPWRDSGWKQAVFVDDVEHELYAFLSEEQNRGALVVPQARRVGSLTTVYTPLRAWWVQYGTTPYAETRADELRRFFAEGVAPPTWRTRLCLVVFVREAAPADPPAAAAGSGARRVFANERFLVYRVEPQAR